MGEITQIAWTKHTFNPWIGCTKVSPGCDNCYAEAQDHRWGHDSWGKGKPRRRTSTANWNQPVKWNREATLVARKDYVFCGSLCDVMDDEAPEGTREDLWRLINNTPHLIWQLLTKRPHRYERYLPNSFRYGNVWLGTTCEDQHFYDVRWPILDKVRDRCAAVFISYEPALGPLSVTGFDTHPDWIIFGGESGPNRRPMEPIWAENIRVECHNRNIAFFMKQMSARTPHEGAALIPPEMLIRQFPEIR